MAPLLSHIYLRGLHLHISHIVSVLLVLGMATSLAWQSAQWLRLLREPSPPNLNSAAPQAQSIDPQQLATLFGAPSEQHAKPAPDTQLKLSLLGSFVHADPKRSSAIIASNGQHAERFALNDTVSPGVRLYAVAADHIELLRDGRRERLSFPQAASAQPIAPNNQAPDDTDEELANVSQSNIEQLRERMDALHLELKNSSAAPVNAATQSASAPPESATENL